MMIFDASLIRWEAIPVITEDERIYERIFNRLPKLELTPR